MKDPYAVWFVVLSQSQFFLFYTIVPTCKGPTQKRVLSCSLFEYEIAPKYSTEMVQVLLLLPLALFSGMLVIKYEMPEST